MKVDSRPVGGVTSQGKENMINIPLCWERERVDERKHTPSCL